ncbi:hypothetical protein ABVK25_007663 [Lepraria finkii]|uniref:Uncharacterized protein n=1 Tax=Lepraria finkii TaxID=1340010 RepID=A0ABR4B233_9LECA
MYTLLKYMFIMFTALIAIAHSSSAFPSPKCPPTTRITPSSNPMSSSNATSVLFPPTLHDPNRQHLQHLLLQHHDPTVPHQLQGYKAALNNANTIASHNKSCCLAFYESVQCGTLEQTSIEVAVPRNAMECKPIESDLLGNLISMGARNVRMSCA